MVSIIQIQKFHNTEMDVQCYFALFLGCTGGDTCCTATNPCDVDQGDCDTDEECKTGLRCGTDNCSIKTGLEWDATDDCCYAPGGIELILTTKQIITLLKYTDIRNIYILQFRHVKSMA